jgi:hypothetical protein
LTQSPAESEALLIKFVYGDLAESARKLLSKQDNYLFKRAILAPLNKDMWMLNALVTAKIPGVEVVSKSIDMPDPDGFDSLLEECLNKI